MPAPGLRRRLMWWFLAVALIGLPFLSLPGRYVNDTRDSLWLAPNTYMAHVFQLWRNSPFLGFEQHDGIAFPMGSTIWLLHAAHLPIWVVERLWHGLLLFGAAAFTVILMDRLRGRRTVTAPLVAALSYSLTPLTFGYGLPFTGTFLAYVVLPLLLLIVVIGAERTGLAWPALFGLATFLMGGGNGAPQTYALITCMLLLAWIAFVDRSVPSGRALRFGAFAALFFVGINAYWLFLLGSSEIRNALLFSEVPKVINVDSSPAESIRGLGLWLFYGGDQFGPWSPAVRAYVTSPLLIVTGFALPIGALASAWLVRWRLRLFFAALIILGVFVAGGVFPANAPTPFGKVLTWSYDHLPGVGGLRTTYKFVASLDLAVAVLVGMGVEPALAALRRLRRGPLLRAGAIVAVAGVVAANSFPLWTGHLYPLNRSMQSVPDYWRQALAALPRLDGGGRAFFAPATSRAYYRWGLLKEGVVAAAPELPAVDPIRLPVADRYGSNLLLAVEQPYFSGTGVSGSAVLLRYLGVTNVVLQDDLDWQRSHTARPVGTHQLLYNREIHLGPSFGSPRSPGPARPSESPFDRFEASLPPVQVLSVSSPLPLVRAEPSEPVILAGDGFGLASAAAGHLLDGNPPVLYSASLDGPELATAFRQHPRIIITDSNRRRVWLFTVPTGRYSATLPAGQTINHRQTGWSLFGSTADAQSVAIYPGIRSLRASSDVGSLGSPAQFRPALAFDGDPGTWWLSGQGQDPAAAWIQANLTRPRTLTSLAITLPPARAARPIQSVTLRFATGEPVTALVRAGGTTVIRFPERRTAWVRVSAARVAPAISSSRPVGIADIGIPGIHPAEIIQVPNDLVRSSAAMGLASTLASLPITYLFERQRTGPSLDTDEEAGISRRFDLPAALSMSLAGTAHLNASAPDDAIDRLLLGRQPVTVSSSSRLGGNVAYRASSAFDGDPSTEWIPDGSVGQWWRVRFPPARVGAISIVTDVRVGRTPILSVTAALSDGSTVDGTLTSKDGVIQLRFAPRVITSVSLSITSAFAPQGLVSSPVGIEDVRIPGVPPLRPPTGPLPCTVGPGGTLDGSPLSLQLQGTAGDLLRGASLPVVTCQSQPLAMAEGSHDLRVGGAIQPDVLALSSDPAGSSGETGGASDAAPVPATPAVSDTHSADGRFTISIQGASAPYYLSIGQNYTPRWRASIDGHDLGPPIVLDGYSAGWYVTRRGSYTVQVTYGPQQLYSLALLFTGASLTIAGGILAVRRRRRRSKP